MAWQRVIQANEIAEGKQKIVEVGGKEVGLFYEGGAYYAVLNFCPHAGAPVCRGWVEGTVTADASGCLDYNADRKVLRCPWHHWEFELATGKAVAPIKQKIRTYPVEVRDGWLYVDV